MSWGELSLEREGGFFKNKAQLKGAHLLLFLTGMLCLRRIMIRMLNTAKVKATPSMAATQFLSTSSNTLSYHSTYR